MGDRVLFQIVHKTNPEDFSPAIYCHWSGNIAPQIVRALRDRMEGRGGDVDYAAARLVQICTEGDYGNLSFGIFNVDHVLDAGDSHGDAGVILIDCADGFKCTCLDSYFETGADGMPKERS